MAQLKSTPSLKPFVCVNCGKSIKELFKIYSPSVIKVLKCEKCHKVADKYIEFEPAIILIDMMLLSRTAYRHVLYNADFKLFWKLSLVILLSESFALWRQKLSDPTFLKFKEIESGFYICCLENIIDNIILFVVLQILSICFTIFNKNDDTNKYYPISITHLIKGITVANYGKIFLLLILIWKDNTTEIGETIHYILVMGYFFISFILVYSVVSNMSIIRSTTLVLFAFGVKHFTSKHLRICLENFL